MADLSRAERAIYDDLMKKLRMLRAGCEYVGATLDDFTPEKVETAFVADDATQEFLISSGTALDACLQSLAATSLLLQAFSVVVSGEASVQEIILGGEPGDAMLSEQDVDDLRKMFEAPDAEKGGDS